MEHTAKLPILADEGEEILHFLLELQDKQGDTMKTYRQNLLEAVGRFFRAKAVILYISIPGNEMENRKVEVLEVVGPEQGLIRVKQLRWGEEVAGKTCALRQGRLISRLSIAPTETQKAILSIKQNTLTLMSIPIMDRKEVIAVLELYDTLEGRGFTTRDYNRFTILGQLLSSHILRILEWERASLEKERLEQLLKLGYEVGASHDLNLLSSLIEEMALKLVPAEGSLLFLLDEAQQDLFTLKKDKIQRVPLGEGLVGKCAWAGKPFMAPSISRSPDYLAHYDAQLGIHMRNLVTVPLKTPEKIHGVLEVVNKKDGTWTAEDIQILESFCNTVAVAIQNARLLKEVERLFISNIEALAEAIDAKDPYTHGHTQRVRDFTMGIGRRLIKDTATLRKLELSALLHDVGKIGTRENILNKEEGLTEKEYQHMKEHVLRGAQILQNIPNMEEVIGGVKHHHERYDGSGYPEKLKGAEIPLFGRIIAVADTFDAMTSDRPYRKGLEDEIALFEIRKFSGKHYDPRVVEAFIQAYEAGEILSQRKRSS